MFTEALRGERERRTGQVKDERDGNEVEVSPNERASSHRSALQPYGKMLCSPGNYTLNTLSV